VLRTLNFGKMKNKLKFYEKSHKYKIGNKELISVTTFIGSFFESFIEREVARKQVGYAKGRNYKKFKKGIIIPELDKKKATQKYWLADWKERREHGTLVHKELENYIKYGRKTKEPKSIQGYKALDYLADENYMFSRAEEVIFNEELGIAGTIDLMIGHTNNKGEQLVSLVDWKTCKKVDNIAYDDKKGIKKPLLEVSDTKINKYTLQLSLYAYMLELRGFEIDKLYIVHLLDDEYRLIPVCYDKELIIKMLEVKEK